jgi:hypothetical protein
LEASSYQAGYRIEIDARWKDIPVNALTAMASNMQLSVYFDPAASPYPITNAVQLAAQ